MNDSQVTDANGNYLFTGIPAASSCDVTVDGATAPADTEPGDNCLDTFNDVDIIAGTAFLDADFCFMPIIMIEIDFKPGSDPSCFNSDGKGVTPVTIFGSSTFDVTSIDPITLEMDGQPVKFKKNGNPLVSFKDVNDDDYEDLKIKFVDEGIYSTTDSMASITGFLLNGLPIFGTSDICITR